MKRKTHEQQDAKREIDGRGASRPSSDLLNLRPQKAYLQFPLASKMAR